MGLLDGKVCLVTGAASGIGEATAKLFVEEGATVVLTDRQVEKGEAAAQAIGAGASFKPLDVTSLEAWQQVVGETVAEHGTLDVLVNNAGVLLFQDIAGATEKQIRLVMDVNLIGVIFGTQTAGNVMMEKGTGSIVNISSVDGLTSGNALAIYGASKWGVRGFTKGAAMEFGHRGVRVNSIHPGGVFTPLANPLGNTKEQFDNGFKIYPAQKSCYPIEIAKGALYFASDLGSYCMGSELAIDGGMTAGRYYWQLPGAPAKPE